MTTIKKPERATRTIVDLVHSAPTPELRLQVAIEYTNNGYISLATQRQIEKAEESPQAYLRWAGRPIKCSYEKD